MPLKKKVLKLLRMAANEHVKLSAPTQYKLKSNGQTIPINHYRRIKRIMVRRKLSPVDATNVYTDMITKK